MRHTRIGFVIGLAVVALAVTGCGGDDESASDTTDTETTATTTATETGMTLNASVGPGFEIGLTTEDGQAVETLAPGSYTLLTNDQADIHNFHLTGEGVDVDTGVSQQGTDSFDITVTAGTYDFVCDPHASSMNGSFEVS